MNPLRSLYLCDNNALSCGRLAPRGDAVFQEKRQETITSKENELNDLEKELTQQLFTLSEAAKESKEEEIRKKKLELKRLLEDSEYELSLRKKEALEKINIDIVELIQKIGERGNYSLILEITGGNVIYANTALDLTDAVIAEYDQASQ